MIPLKFSHKIILVLVIAGLATIAAIPLFRQKKEIPKVETLVAVEQKQVEKVEVKKDRSKVSKTVKKPDGTTEITVEEVVVDTSSKEDSEVSRKEERVTVFEPKPKNILGLGIILPPLNSSQVGVNVTYGKRLWTTPIFGTVGVGHLDVKNPFKLDKVVIQVGVSVLF